MIFETVHSNAASDLGLGAPGMQRGDNLCFPLCCLLDLWRIMKSNVASFFGSCWCVFSEKNAKAPS